MNKLCKRLKQLRMERNLSQKEVADTIGISLRAYQYYESAERNPDTDILEKIADYYEVTTDYLLGRTEKHNNDLTIE